MRGLLSVVLAMALPSFALVAQDRQAEERHFLYLKHSSYFVIKPRKAPATGKPVRSLVVLPGGDGSKELLPFVRDSIAAQVPDECVVAMLTAVKWRDDQTVVWPTAAAPVPGMEYPTEKLVHAVAGQVAREFHVEPVNAAVLAWSSSGPAIHPLLAQQDAPFQRAYIAMSVWPEGMPDLAAVKGRRYVLDQSPDDQTTIFQHARDAHAALTKAGAVVRLSTYRGGHGWQDDPLPRLRAGLKWLFGNDPASKPDWPVAKAAKQGGKLVNQLANGSFEQGSKGWHPIDNSGSLKVEADTKEKAEGRQSLRLSKPGPGKPDLVVQNVDLPAGRTVAASLRIKSKGVGDALVKVWLYDKDGKPTNEQVDLVRVPADGDWQPFAKEWPANGAVRATVQILMLAGGELWVDDVVLTVDG